MAKAATRAEFPFIIWKENLKEASSEQLFQSRFPFLSAPKSSTKDERPTISLSPTSRTHCCRDSLHMMLWGWGKRVFSQ